jgi:uncharacterized FlaG/YvyC family protein
MDTSNVKESIDERILRLLGLEDVFDLDYDTYLTLLKEAMVKGRMPKTTIPTDEIEALTNEYKRVKGKKNKGRFEVKKGKKINSSSFNIGKTKGLIAGSKSIKALPAAIGTSPVAKSLDDNISAITAAVVSIHEIIKQQQNLLFGSLETDRRRREKEKGAAAENKLEKRFEGLKKIAEKIIAPVKSILDKIINFLVNVLLGRVVIKLIDWLADPKNASKVKSIIRFVGDWWPALLGAYVLFGTTFGKFVRGTVGMLGRFIFQIGKVAIPQLLRLIKSPLGVGAALFTAGATVPAMFPGTVNEQERKTTKAPGSTKDKIQQLQTQKANLNVFEKLQGKGSEIDEQISLLQTGKTKGYGFSGGGFNGFVSGEKGVDKVPAMLSDGEFVMSRGAVAKYGVDALESMNAAGGGTNRPKIINGVPHAAGGGQIGLVRDPVGSIQKFIKYKFGADTGKQATWGPSSSNARTSPTTSGNYSSGSLLTDPMGAISRIAGIKTPNVSSSKSNSGSANNFNRIMNAVQNKISGGKKPKGSSKEKGFFGNLGSATYRDAGSIYAKQMMGELGGPISEQDISKESQAELQKAIGRAKKRTGSEISKAEAKIKELEASGASKTAKGKEALATQRSFLKKLKAGGIRVQYTDYNDEKGKLSESAKNAKNILGQFWATGRSKKEGGGYRIEDKYDFDMLKKKDSKTGKMRDMNTGELIKEGVFGKGKTIQQRLQAAHLLNPFKGKGDVDMVLGGKRTTSEAMGLLGSKNPIGAMFGMSGNPNSAKIAKSKPVAKPIKPPAKPQAKVVYGPPVPSRSKGKTGGAPKSKVPNFTAGAPGMRSKQQTLGLMR